MESYSDSQAPFASEDTKQRIIRKFHSDTSQHLEVLRRNLTLLGTPEHAAAVKTLFMAAHTIKGNAGMMELLEVDVPGLVEPAGQMEALFYELQNGQTVFGPDLSCQLEKLTLTLEESYRIICDGKTQ